MIKFILKRLLFIIPTLLAIILLVFTIMNLTPGSPGREILGPLAPQEDVDQLNHELGYDRPFFTRLFSYIGGILQGDFGESYNTGKPVFREIFGRFPTTLRLAVLSVGCATILGVPLGVLSAVKQYSLTDRVSTITALVLSAVPTFWLGLLLLLLFALRLDLLPSGGVDSWQSYILPTATLCLPGAANLMRTTRSNMLETVRQAYIRTAKAKGAPKNTIIWHHAVRNALLPVVTSVGLSFGGMLGGTVLAESVFAMPGLGTLILNGINGKDVPLVMGATIFLAAMFCLIMLVVDIIYGFIDPRVKAMYLK